MASERTLSIVKPDAVKKNHIGGILAKLEGAKLIKLSPEQAGAFYGVHRERPFFQELVDFMTSGPIMVQVLEGENAILRNREVMGATDPAKAEAGTIRAAYGASIGENAVHGSDGPDTARGEIAFFFAESELQSR